MTTNNIRNLDSGLAAPTSRRAVTVAIAVVSAAVVYGIERLVVADPFTVSYGNGAAPQTVGIGSVLVSSAIASLLGWGVLVLLEKVMPTRATTLWTVLAVLVLLLSFGGPFGAVAATSTKLSLALLHVVVGAVLISRLPRR